MDTVFCPEVEDWVWDLLVPLRWRAVFLGVYAWLYLWVRRQGAGGWGTKTEADF